MYEQKNLRKKQYNFQSEYINFILKQRMNQRASHFTLGSSNVAYTSIYNKDYVGKEASKATQTAQNPFRGSSLQHGDIKGSFQTTNKQLMQNWGQVQHAKLDSKKLQNLRGHHFTLGNYNPASLQTSHKLFYNQKQLNSQASNKQQQSKTKMRMHNHDFKEQNWTNFQSSYKKNFLKPEGEVNGRIVKEELKGAIVLGNHNTQMISTNAMEYTQKRADNKQALLMKQSLQQTSSLVLGNSASHEPMQTVNQQYYTAKPIQPNNLPQSTMKQLRSTHFNLGSMKPSYQTETNLYTLCTSSTQNKFQIPTYESGTWVDKEAKFSGQTTNKLEFGEKNVEPYKKYQTKVKRGFELGGYKQNYQTQFKRNFVQRGTLNARAANAKKEDNIVIGMSQGSYISEQKANYIDRDIKQAQTNSASIKLMNTEDHFKIGGTSGQAKVTTYQDEYRKDLENRNRMFHNDKK